MKAARAAPSCFCSRRTLTLISSNRSLTPSSRRANRRAASPSALALPAARLSPRPSQAAAASPSLGDGVVVDACHPSSETKSKRTPTPLLLLFADAPDLLVEGGSLSDAAAFL